MLCINSLNVYLQCKLFVMFALEIYDNQYSKKHDKPNDAVQIDHNAN